jgi:hypothetical protein
VGEDTVAIELTQARAQLSEANAVRASVVNELTAAREKIVLYETRENERERQFRFDQRAQAERMQQLDMEMSRRTARLAELEREVLIARANRDTALESARDSHRRLEELESVVQHQSDLIQEGEKHTAQKPKL